jgi:hypothetical protein
MSSHPVRHCRVPLVVKSLLNLLFIVAGVSCISPQPVDAGFKARKGQKVAVVTLAAPTATVHHIGGQGLLDIALNQSFASKGRKRLEDYPSQTRLDDVGRRIAQRLNAIGYKANLVAEHPDPKNFAPMIAKPSVSKPIPGRDTWLKGYDAALFIAMPMVGQAQMVYGFIPLSGRNGMALMNASMFSVLEQKRLYRSPLGQAGPRPNCAVEGAGDDITNVFRAVDKAVNLAADELHSDFFKGL